MTHLLETPCRLASTIWQFFNSNGQVWLDVKVHPLADLPGKDDTALAYEKSTVVAPAAVTLLTAKVRIRFQQAVVPYLHIPAARKAVVPLFFRFSFLGHLAFDGLLCFGQAFGD
jgi:hypothetical protein